MAVEVRLPTVLRTHAGGASSVQLDGATVGEVLAKLVAEYPGLSGQVVQDDGSLHKFVNVYVNDDDVRYLQGLDTPGPRWRRDLDPAGRGRGRAGSRGLGRTAHVDDACYELRPGADREHPAGGHQRAEPEPRRPASSSSSRGRTPADRSRTGSPCR